MHGKLQTLQDLLTQARSALRAQSQYKGYAAIEDPLQAIQDALDAAEAYCADPGVSGINWPTVNTVYLPDARRAVEQLWQEVSTTMSPVEIGRDMMRLDARTLVYQLHQALVAPR